MRWLSPPSHVILGRILYSLPWPHTISFSDLLMFPGLSLLLSICAQPERVPLSSHLDYCDSSSVPIHFTGCPKSPGSKFIHSAQIYWVPAQVPAITLGQGESEVINTMFSYSPRAYILGPKKKWPKIVNKFSENKCYKKAIDLDIALGV